MAPAFSENTCRNGISPRAEIRRGNGRQQELRITAAAMIRMHADRRDLGIVGRLHPLSRHRYQLPVNPDAEERSQFVGSRSERTGVGQFCQRHHRRDVSCAEGDDIGRVARGFAGQPDHLLAGRGEQNLELRRRVHRIGREQHGVIGSRHQRAKRRETRRRGVDHCRKRRNARWIAPRPRAALRQRRLPGCQGKPDRMIERMDRRAGNSHGPELICPLHADRRR